MSDPIVRARRDFFDGMYRSGEPVPWDRKGEPQVVLRDWATRGRVAGGGRRASVIGCGHGGDAEYVAGLGFATDAFDFAPTAIEAARAAHPDSAVRYEVADLFDLPADWIGRYDLVVESLTVQSLPRSVRPGAVRAARSLLAPGGTLLVIAEQAGDDEEDPTGPWPLSRADVESFAGDGVRLVRLDEPAGADGQPRWRAELTRDSGTG